MYTSTQLLKLNFSWYLVFSERRLLDYTPLIDSCWAVMLHLHYRW